jgi:hypothetical protein
MFHASYSPAAVTKCLLTHSFGEKPRVITEDSSELKRPPLSTPHGIHTFGMSVPPSTSHILILCWTGPLHLCLLLAEQVPRARIFCQLAVFCVLAFSAD